MLSHSRSVFPEHQGSHRTQGAGFPTLIVLFISPHNKRPDVDIWDFFVLFFQRAVPSENYPNVKL